MKIKKYIENCYETWGKGNEEKRILIGIEEEFGELAGKVKRWYRGDYADDKEKLLNDVKAEIGDCLYYLAMAIDVFDFKSDFSIQDGKLEDFDLFESWQALNTCKNIYLSEKKYNELFMAVILFANALGLRIEDVIEYNIKKLQDRKKRGVIKGNGDNR